VSAFVGGGITIAGVVVAGEAKGDQSVALGAYLFLGGLILTGGSLIGVLVLPRMSGEERERVTELSARARGAAARSDCAGADASVAELRHVDADSARSIVETDAAVRECVRSACAARRHEVFERARHAESQDERMLVLRETPQCD
jgi:hypothetical protein